MERLANLPDLGSAFTAGLLAVDKAEDRHDGPEPHVSDLGKCDFMVWGRRNGQPMIPHAPKTAARLQAGLHMESFVIDRIESGLPEGEGWQIERAGVIEAEDGMVGHLDAVLARSRCVCGKWAKFAVYKDGGTSWWCCDKTNWETGAPESTERAYFDVKTTTFKEEWYQTGEFFPDTGKPVKRKRFVPYDDFPGPSYHFQSGGYCQRMPRNPDGKHMPYAIAAFDWASKEFVPFGWFDSDNEGFVQSHDVETKRKLTLTAPGVDPIAVGIATLRSDGEWAGIPPEDSLRANGRSWMCGYCDFALCALNTNPDAEIL